MKKYQRCLSENFKFLEVKFSIYLNRRVYVMPGPALVQGCKKEACNLVLISFL